MGDGGTDIGVTDVVKSVVIPVALLLTAVGVPVTKVVKFAEMLVELSTYVGAATQVTRVLKYEVATEGRSVPLPVELSAGKDVGGTNVVRCVVTSVGRSVPLPVELSTLNDVGLARVVKSVVASVGRSVPVPVQLSIGKDVGITNVVKSVVTPDALNTREGSQVINVVKSVVTLVEFSIAVGAPVTVVVKLVVTKVAADDELTVPFANETLE